MPVPPKSVQHAAAKGLRLRREHGKGGTEVGVARARDLSNGADISGETLGRMRSFFARHAVNKQADNWSTSESDPSPSYIAWLLWGGDAGRRWAESQRDDSLDAVRYLEVAVRTDERTDAVPPAMRDLLAEPRPLPDGGWVLEGVAAMPAVKRYDSGTEYTPWAVLAEHLDGYEGLRAKADHQVVTPASPGAEEGRVLGASRLDGHEAIKVRIAVARKPDAAGLSVGYTPVEVDPTPGEALGQRYDAIWTRAIPNHLMFTPSPRVPGAALRLDTRPQEAVMPQITINGVVQEVTEAFAAAWRDDKAEATKRLDALTQERNDAAAKRDELAGQVKALEATRQDSDKVREEALALAKLWAEAKPLLGADDVSRLDSMSEAEIKRAVLKRAFPDTQFGDGEVDGAYKVALARRSDSQPGAAQDIDGVRRSDSDDRRDSTTGYKRLGVKHLKQDF